jgi:prevent-host-death family protein
MIDWSLRLVVLIGMRFPILEAPPMPATIPTKTIQASEAKTHFLRILDDVERGETVTITRHGKTVARIVPDQVATATAEAARREKIEIAIREIEQLRKRVGKMSLAEILDARNEGRM